MSKTAISIAILAAVLAQSAANAATAPVDILKELPHIGAAPVISDAAKAQILKSDSVQVASKKRPFKRAFLQENGPTFAQYTQALKYKPDTEEFGPIADIRAAFEQFRSVG